MDCLLYDHLRYVFFSIFNDIRWFFDDFIWVDYIAQSYWMEPLDVDYSNSFLLLAINCLSDIIHPIQNYRQVKSSLYPGERDTDSPGF